MHSFLPSTLPSFLPPSLPPSLPPPFRALAPSRQAQAGVETIIAGLGSLSRRLGEGWGGYSMAHLDELAKLAEAMDARVALLDPPNLEVATHDPSGHTTFLGQPRFWAHF